MKKTTFAEVIKHACMKMDISQAELARRMGISAPRVTVMLQCKNIKESTFRAAADALGMEPVIRLVKKDAVEVPSQTKQDEAYHTTTTSCTCPGFKHVGKCKHIIAYRAVLLEKDNMDKTRAELIMQAEREFDRECIHLGTTAPAELITVQLAPGILDAIDMPANVVVSRVNNRVIEVRGTREQLLEVADKCTARIAKGGKPAHHTRSAKVAEKKLRRVV